MKLRSSAYLLLFRSMAGQLVLGVEPEIKAKKRVD